MPRKKKVEVAEQINIVKNNIKIDNYKDCRLMLVMALNSMLAGEITPTQNKSIAYSIQCIISSLNKEMEIDEFAGQDSLEELVKIIHLERAKAKKADKTA